MSRALYLNMSLNEATARCHSENVGVSALEALVSGGVRLVCMSAAGAEQMRSRCKSRLLGGEVTRERHRPSTPIW